ncbi:hypothetical protein ACFVVL_07745 [Kitasatospora sp. NPDC058115]
MNAEARTAVRPYGPGAPRAAVDDLPARPARSRPGHLAADVRPFFRRFR